MSCQVSNASKNHELTIASPLQQNPNKHITAPEDAMQIDLVAELPPPGGYENIVTAMGVSSRYLFAYPTSNQEAKKTAKVLISIMTTDLLTNDAHIR